ncbi:hypothetical protein ACNA6I_22870 [Rossellomorea sp. FS2]|uniref:rolling circle replication-associated protein n=1 Tax=Rossellomorea sp. FS2 TaxID=3391447 RepID=UPI003A4D2A33
MGETNKKIIKSGNIVEVWEYEEPLKYGYTRKPRDADPHLSNSVKRQEHFEKHLLDLEYQEQLRTLDKAYKAELLSLEEYEDIREAEASKVATRHGELKKKFEAEKIRLKEEYQNRSVKRTLEKATRLVNANEQQLQRFLTLTFKQDVVDIEYANSQFNKFIKRVRTYLRRVEVDKINKRRKKNKVKVSDQPLPNIEYVSVIEFQTLSRNYVVHYHLLWSAPYIPFEKLLQLWGLGGVWINKIDRSLNVGNYILKYMKKSFKQVAKEEGEEFDFEAQLKAKKSMDLLWGRQRVLRSEGLKEPVEYKEKSEIQKIEFRLNDDLYETGNTYDTEYFGRIQYRRYHLRKLDK